MWNTATKFPILPQKWLCEFRSNRWHIFPKFLSMNSIPWPTYKLSQYITNYLITLRISSMKKITGWETAFFFWSVFTISNTVCILSCFLLHRNYFCAFHWCAYRPILGALPLTQCRFSSMSYNILQVLFCTKSINYEEL